MYIYIFNNMCFYVPSVGNFFGLFVIISYPFGIIGRFVCYVIYMLTVVYKVDDKLHNNPEYLFFLNNCAPVNDDHKHNDHPGSHRG